MKRLTLSWLGLAALVVGAFLFGCLVGPRIPHYKLVKVDVPATNAQLGQIVPLSDLPDSLKGSSGNVDKSDLPYPAPPCKNGSKVCNPWERAWKPGETLPAGAIVEPDGTVWPRGKN
jgi:hypothetical protein